MLLFALASFVIPVFAATQNASGSVNLDLYNTNITQVPLFTREPRGLTVNTYGNDANVSGVISLTGDYAYQQTVTNNVSTTVNVPGSSSTGRAGNVSITVSAGGGVGRTVVNYTSVVPNAAPIYLSGTVTLYYKSSNGTSYITQDIAFGGPYYTDSSVAFYNVFNVSYDDAYYAVVQVEATSGPNGTGSVLAEVATTTSNPEYGTAHNVWFAQNIWIGIVALPAFNDTAFGAWVKSDVFRPTVPIGGLYNIMAIIGLIVLAFSVVFGFIPMGRRDRGYGLGPQLANVAVGVGVILVFPYVYDRVAIEMNYLNAYLIAYPEPYTTFLARLWEIQTNIIAPPNTNFWSILRATAFFIAYAVVWMITWIMIYFLGTVRILLIAAMLVMFPLSVALRDIPFTSKLGRMIDDTLFGLMLATILSASMLSTASWLLTNWNTPTNIFVMGGFQPQWVAIAAILGAILAPTVLAPLTSTLFETSSEVAMFGGAVGMNIAYGGLGGGMGALQNLGGGLPGAGAAGGGAVGAVGAMAPVGGWRKAGAFIAGAGRGAGVFAAHEFITAPIRYGGGPVVHPRILERLAGHV
ncbi:hypothetical protein NAS2_0679 [Conexivisphaera calida]|uniref:Uncharacterized protein n=1 Tax=Conexivisphaera calida TaxID=1874277 RepID=A0A4P2VLU9_9ARCH|nr:hypothetical protein NAS2_0679 [Conexivisphaera calida]